jgi:phage tail sheath protein FI
MPGVTITTAVRTGPTSATVRESSQAFFVGLAQRGPSDEAVLVRSLAEFEETFGTYVTYAYLHPTVQTFFEEGGTQCYIARVVGPDATTATRVLNEGGVGGSDCITLTANGPGDWAHNMDIQVTASGDLRNIKLFYNDDLVYQTGNKSTTTALVNAINNSAIASKYMSAVKLTDDLPQVEAATAFGAGSNTDGSDDRDADEVAVDFTAYSDALELFLDSYGTGAVVCPETHEINTELIVHANAYNRIALLHLQEAATDPAGDAATLSAEDHSEHAAVFYPWVYVPTDVAGVNRLIPPTGYAAGKRALAHNQTGPHQPYAGLVSSARFVNGVEVDVNRTLGDSLDADYVNAIRLIANSVRIYGARSLSTDTDNFRFITIQDTVNSVVVEANASMEDLVFAVVDGRGGLFASIEGRLTAICERMKSIGALYEAYDANGKLIDPGYSVKCDTSINTTAQLAEGTIKAQLGVRVSSVGDKIEVTIIKSNLTSSVTV